MLIFRYHQSKNKKEIMLKNNKKSTQYKKNTKKANVLFFKNWSLKVKVISIFVVAIFGMLAVTGAFAQSKRNDYTLKVPVEQTAISLTDEKPLVISKDNSGKIVYESRGKSIDVTVSGTVYCTPEDNGPVKIASVTPEQLSKTTKEIEEIKPTNGLTKQNASTASIGNNKQLQLPKDSDVAPINTDLSNPLPGVNKSEQILDKLCANATTIVPDSQIPAFIPDKAPQPKKKKRTLLENNVLSLLMPKTYAADAPVPITTPPPAISEVAENDQVGRINVSRSENGLPLLAKSDCLTRAARSWSLNMATVDKLYHSPLATTVEKECGQNWWHKLGENVGYGSGSYEIFLAYMNSPGHRANILDQSFQRVGVGAYTYQHPSRKWTLLWTTQLFVQCQGSCADK